VKPKWEELNIVPIWNVPYRYQFNEACEKYWAQLKQKFRSLLLMKMIREPKKKDMPLRESVLESIAGPSRESIPKFVKKGLASLKQEAEQTILESKRRVEETRILFGDDDAESEIEIEE
jgi:hypothetical protein